MSPKREIQKAREPSDTADPLVSPNVETGGSDVAFAEGEYDAPLFIDEYGRPGGMIINIS